MSISTLRDELSEQMLAFAWSEWAQMGVLADTPETDRWAADPEALLLFTLELGRDDPRLLDELRDWLLVNERLLSTQRLHNLAQNPEDRALIDSALAWTAGRRSRAIGVRAAARRSGNTRSATSEKSRPPQLERPINFAFRLRALLGIGARAETVRILLGSDARALPVQQIARNAAYAKRNVQEALSALHSAGAIQAASAGNERHYAIDKQRWAQLLALDDYQLPAHREWPALLGALRQVARWLADLDNQRLSDYMRASRARELTEALAPSLQAAGVAVRTDWPSADAYWTEFTDITRAAVRALRIGR